MSEPDTMMGSTQTDLPPMDTGKRGKSGKKKKLTKAEKTTAKLTKDAQAIQTDPARFGEFISKVDHWLKLNHKQAIKLFKKFDVANQGVLSYDEFKAGLLDLLMPCTAVELHLLCMLLDTLGLEEVQYSRLAQGLTTVREREANHRQSDLRPPLQLTDRDLVHCKKCNLVQWDGENFKEKYPRYIKLHLILVTFDGFRHHPGHVTQVVPSHIAVHNLLTLIQQVTHTSSNQLAIFTDKSRDVEAMLEPERTLEECGYNGGPMNKPQHLTLYYDYKAEITDCPLLMCDHYFGKKTTSMSMSPRKGIADWYNDG